MATSTVKGSKLLIIDDDESAIRVITAVLKDASYDRFSTLTDPREASRYYSDFEPDLILIDLLMPYMDGLEVIEGLQSRIPRNSFLPILVLTADAEFHTRQRALTLGAKDFLTKPFNRVELILRVGNLLETRLLYVQIHGSNVALEEQVRQGACDLDQAQAEVIGCLEKVASYRDEETSQHCKRVSLLATLIARAIGFSEDRAQLIGAASTLHDIGKIGIPDRILLKPGKLTPDEFDQIKTHTAIGAEILSISHSSIVKVAGEIAHYHHERWDGQGYNGLSGENIPVAARIVALADTFDVLTHDRPYRRAWSADRAVAEIHGERGRQFDPGVVDAFLGGSLNRDLCALRTNLADIDQAPAPGEAETVSIRCEVGKLSGRE
jgi:putative two-component system response regulator